MRKPTVVECLRGKKIIHVAVGALHCLAVGDTGQVSVVSVLESFILMVDIETSASTLICWLPSIYYLLYIQKHDLA